MSRRAVWEQIYARFDPHRPALDPAWRADRERSPAGEIVRSLRRKLSDPRVLLMGTIGTGKSTELLRIAEALAGHDNVVLVDLHRHMIEVVGDENALERMQSWEVVFLAGLSVVKCAAELLPYPIPKDLLEGMAAAWHAIAHATGTPTPPQIDIPGLAKAMIVAASAAAPLIGAPAGVGVAVGAGLKVFEKAADAVKWFLPVGRGSRSLPDQDAGMQTLLGAVNLVIGHVQTHAGRLVVLIDGLDRLRDIGHAEKLFLRSELIPQLACPVVVCGPFALRSHPAASALPRFSEICVLVNEPVMDQKNPRTPGPGVAFFCELFRRRLGGLHAHGLVPDDLLEKLAYYSGGRARDFVRSIRALAEQAWEEDAETATPALVHKVLDKARRLMETGLDAGHIELLEKVVRDSTHRLPRDSQARELLTYGQLLPYPNESEWYYPHPLLLLSLVKPTGSTT